METLDLQQLLNQLRKLICKLKIFLTLIRAHTAVTTNAANEHVNQICCEGQFKSEGDFLKGYLS